MEGRRAMPGICWALVRAGMREEMQFRANFIVEVAFGLVYQTIGFAFIWVVLGKFQAIGEWNLQDVTLLYGIQLLGYALWTLAFSRILNVPAMVQMGEFDTMLVRPMSIALQFMFGGFRIAVLGNLLGAVVVLGAGLRAADIAWSPSKVLFLVLAVLGSGLIRGGFELAASSLVFRSLDTGWVQYLSYVSFGEFGSYPLDIFGREARRLLTFVIPVAFTAWVPAAVLLDRPEVLPFPAWVAWGTPVLGVACTAASWCLFLRESRQYQSTGS